MDETYWETVRRAAGVLADGGLVVFPTETVYGVGARADLGEAVARLRSVKQRGDEKPFTVHIGRRDDAKRYVPEPSRIARRLMRKAWPGPLTLLVRVPDVEAAPIVGEIDRGAAQALYHQGIIGLRCPGEDRARDLLNEAGAPVVAASANLAGRRAPQTASEALRDLDGKVDLVLDGGRTRLAGPSTIVQVNGAGYRVLRAGVYDERVLEQMTTLNILFVCSGNTCRSPMAAALCERLLTERLGGGRDALRTARVSITSAGMFAGSGAGASENAVKIMGRRGIDLSGHRSLALSIELIHQADLIYVMTEGHLDGVVNMVPSARERCRLLCDKDVADPAGGTEEEYAGCAEKLEAGVRARLDEVEL